MTNMGVVSKGSTESRVAGNSRTGRLLENRAAIPGPWVYLLTGLPDLDTGESPAYGTGTTFAGPPYDYPAFRHGLDGSLEWKGHVDISGATSPATLCTLPLAWRIEFAVSWPTDLWDGATFKIGRVSITAVTGVVTLVWPAT